MKCARPYPIARTFLALCMAVTLPGLSAQADPVSVLFDRNNPPYSQEFAANQGIYYDIATMICLAMGSELQPLWADTATTGMLSPLLDEDPVDLVVGVAIEPRTVEDEARVGDRVHYSQPFAAVAYRVITKAPATALTAMKAIGLEKVGVELGSVAGQRLWDEGFVVDPRPTQEDILQGLLQGELGYGVLWENAEWIIHTDSRFKDVLTVHPLIPDYEGMQWNLAAALHPGNDTLARRVNEAIAALLETGALKAVYARYGMTYCDPIPLEEQAR